MEAEIIIGLCDRWHKLPSEVLAEDAGLLRLLTVVGLAEKDRNDA